jgi:hypothetical protein
MILLYKNKNKGIKMAEEIKKDEDWMQKKWRPAMGWMYMIICTLDMGVFPVLWSLLQVFTHQTITQWQPLTLQGAGLFHLAMGAVLGIAAWGRTQEKLGGAANNATTTTPTASTFGSAMPATPSISAPVSTPSANPFGATDNSNPFGSTPPAPPAGISKGKIID